MRWKVFCSLSQELALFTSLQHIICSISQSQLFSLSYCHTHSTTVYHSMPHLTRQQCAHACVQSLMFLLLHCVFLYLFSFGCQLVFGNKHHHILYTFIHHLHLVLIGDKDVKNVTSERKSRCQFVLTEACRHQDISGNLVDLGFVEDRVNSVFDCQIAVHVAILLPRNYICILLALKAVHDLSLTKFKCCQWLNT